MRWAVYEVRTIRSSFPSITVESLLGVFERLADASHAAKSILAPTVIREIPA